jgi:signal transduction histidine kinase
VASSSQRIFYLTIISLFGAAVLRTLVVYWGTPTAVQILGLLAIWMVLFILEIILSSKKSNSRLTRGHFWVYLVLQVSLTIILLARPDLTDYLAILFAILSMQVMQVLDSRVGAVLIAAFALLITLALIQPYGLPQAVALALVFTALNIFLASYSLTYRRTLAARQHNKVLVIELETKSQKLQAYAHQLEQLAAEQERHRLARELHDSVTQTIFSMTLTTQSALLLLDRNPTQVRQQLDRLYQLAQSALSEMQVLITELHPAKAPEDGQETGSRPEKVLGGGLAATIRKHLTDRQLPESLSISMEVEGDQSLTTKEEQGLFRIVQEALNNIIKHSQASQAIIRLHMDEPFWIEVADRGQGFDVQHAIKSEIENGKVGLRSMHERADEIGWDLQIFSSPGEGTRIWIEKSTAQLRGVYTLRK